ncbi:macro domain-containing protein [Undibacterium sp. Di27W]|uniref:macro domain-containing protein n=1 Tax=Undibacterium sp. Di27W TaxID=3413036 RepID=UPI003BF2149A
MKEITGDLLVLALQGQFDVIVHGCNCFCTMGAGIAKTIKKQFPEAYEADQGTLPADHTKLGSYSQASIVKGDTRLVIVNAYTQYDWRGKGVKVDYAAIRKVFASLRHEFAGLRLAYPLLGAGLARGDWDQIAAIIDAELAGMDHTLVRMNTSVIKSA